MDTLDKKNLKKTFFFLRASLLIILFSTWSCKHKDPGNLLFTDTLSFGCSDTAFLQEPTSQEPPNNTIYYGIYSPAEVSKIFNRKNISYNPDILAPLDHLPELNTTSQIAINLGIYGADFSYAHLFQNADAAKYLEVVLKLSEKLGIPPEYIRTLTRRLHFNISSPDSLTQITLEAFNHINRFLIEQDQQNLAYLIVAGAWIEAMYIAAHDLLQDNDPIIIKKIVEQKYSLEYLLSTMKNFYTDTSVAYIYRRLFVLDKYFGKTQIIFNKNNFAFNRKKKTIVSSGNEIFYSKENIEKIKEIIFSLRKLALNK